ncbi:MAG: alpha/beta hydrolase [Rhodothermales bacterium]
MGYPSARLLQPLVLLGLGGMMLSGCFVYNHLGMEVLYREEPLPASRIVEEIAYWDGSDADPDKHRLDLFLPVGEGWPVVVFIHGGGWDSGDKNLSFGGADVYANIGRFLARRGIGAAVINYRLLPEATLFDQVEDAARAVAWVHAHIGEYGGRPEALFLMGHSSGAHLSSRIVFDATALEAFNLSPEAVCGVMAVSGAAYDLTASENVTDEGLAYMEKRFGHIDDWPRQVSSLPLFDGQAPPFLILYARGEQDELQRQSQLLDAALRQAGVASTLVIVPGEGHARIVLTLSRDDKTAGPAILSFLRSTVCE